MKKLLLGGACAASLLLALTPLAHAADMEAVPEAMGMGWYVSVFGGWSHAKDESFSIETTGSTNFFEADLELDDGFMVGAALGAQINEWLRGEVEVSGHFHDVSGTLAQFTTPADATPDLYDVDGDEDALFALANLWVDLPIGGAFRPYIGGGVGVGRLDVDVDFDTGGDSFNLVDDSDWGFAWQIGGG